MRGHQNIDFLILTQIIIYNTFDKFNYLFTCLHSLINENIHNFVVNSTNLKPSDFLILMQINYGDLR